MFRSPSHARPALTLIAVCIGTFMLIIDVQIVVVALPSIRSTLHTSFAAEQWTVDAYSTALAALLLPMGSASDIIGRRKMFALGLAGFTLGSLLCGIAGSGLELVLFRAFQGIGGAIVFATSLALLVQTFEGRKLGLALGAWGAVVNLGLGCGPVLGGLLTEGSWRWIFFVNIPLGIVAIVLTLLGVQEFRVPGSPRIDLLGGAVFTVALVSLIYGLIEAGSGWGSPQVIISLAIALSASIAFPLIERVRRQPMLDLSLLRKPTFVGGLAAALGMNGSLYAILLYLVLYLQDGLGLSALETGLRLLVITVISMIVSLVGGRLSNVVPTRVMIGVGLGLISVGLLLMRSLDGNSSWTHLIAGMVVAGAGGGLLNAPMAETAVGVVSPEHAGMASGINSTFRQIGIAVSIAVLGTIFAAQTASTAGTAAERYADGLNTVLLVAGAIALVAATLGVILIRRKDFQTAAPQIKAAQPDHG